MLLLMMVGPEPFFLNQEGGLQLRFRPALPGWLFTKQIAKIQLVRDNKWQWLELPAKTFSFMFLGDILVTYHNPSLKDTFGTGGVSPVKWTVVESDGNSRIFNEPILEGDFAHKIRDRRVKTIDIELG
jgi:hypothetical protein